MGRTSRHKLWILKFMAQNGRFVMTKKVMSRHGSYPYRQALIMAFSFLSRHIFMLSSSIMSRHNLTVLQHSSVDVVCFMSRHGCLLSRQKFPPPALQLCCNSLCYVATLFMLLFSIYVATELLSCIAETELCVAIDSFHVAIESSLLLVTT